MLKMALIGYGYWGPNVAKKLYENPNINFYGICDIKENRLNLAKYVYANSIMYTQNYKDYIEDSKIDAIAIAVETENHYKLIKEALEHGKHVYVEKPITDSSKQAIELHEIALSRRKILHVDHIMVYHPIIRKIKNLIENNELGQIIYYDCSRINLGNIKNDISSMWDLAVHDLSIIDYLSNGQIPKEVTALGRKMYSTRHSITFLNIQYDTFIANIKSSWLSPIKERKMIIAGTKKMVVFDDMKLSEKLIIYNKGFEFTRRDLTSLEYSKYAVKSRIGDAIIPYIEQADALYNSIQHFVECIEQDKQSYTNAEAALRILNIMEQADRKLLKFK